MFVLWRLFKKSAGLLDGMLVAGAALELPVRRVDRLTASLPGFAPCDEFFRIGTGAAGMCRFPLKIDDEAVCDVGGVKRPEVAKAVPRPTAEDGRRPCGGCDVRIDVSKEEDESKD